MRAFFEGDFLKNLGNIDWNALKRYTSPQAVKDFDAFLDALPLNVGYNALIAAGMAWLLAGSSVFFTSMQVEKVSKIRTELAKVEALKPPVPIIQYVPVSEASLKDLQKKITDTYKGVTFVGTSSSLTVSALDTDYFPQFLAAINTLQNGGKNWRVSVNTLCVGRDCATSKLMANLKLEVARVGDAPKQDEDEAEGGDKK
jgi:hypothetical protein